MKEPVGREQIHQSSQLGFAEISTHASISSYELGRSKALEIFALRGYSQVGMRELAAHIGIKAGSLYHHFPSKQHLLFDLLEEFYEDLNDAADRCLERRSGGVKALQRLVEARLALHDRNPFHTRLAQRDTACLEDDYSRTIGRMRNDFVHKLQRLVELTGPGINPSQDAAAHALSEMVITLPDWLQSQPLTTSQRVGLAENLILGAAERLKHLR